MISWLLTTSLGNAQMRIDELEAERDKLMLALDAKMLECDLQGQLIETYRRQVENLLAGLVHEGRRLGIPGDGPKTKV